MLQVVKTQVSGGNRIIQALIVIRPQLGLLPHQDEVPLQAFAFQQLRHDGQTHHTAQNGQQAENHRHDAVMAIAVAKRAEDHHNEKDARGQEHHLALGHGALKLDDPFYEQAVCRPINRSIDDQKGKQIDGRRLGAGANPNHAERL